MSRERSISQLFDVTKLEFNTNPQDPCEAGEVEEERKKTKIVKKFL